MRILALDQASRVSGWAIFEDENLISYGKIDASKYEDLGSRLHYIREEIKSLIQTENINKVYLEDIYMDGQHVNNVSTFKILAEVFGVLYELCVDINIPVDAVLAGTWKSTLGIKGKTRPEQKKNAQLYIKEKYNLDVIQDIADAICIGKYAIIQQNSEFNWDD